MSATTVEDKTRKAVETRSTRARATLEKLQKWFHWEVLEGPESDPRLIVTTGCERFLWERVSKNEYARVVE